MALLIGVSCALAPMAAAEVVKGPPPAWVTIRQPQLDANLDPGIASGGLEFLMFDHQVHHGRDEAYQRSVLRVASLEGLGLASDITVSYDPSYASLTFHWIRIYRDGDVTDRLLDHEVRTYQREEGMALGLYDGHATAVVNLSDVRVGDIVDYAYTKRGANPILAGHVEDGYYQQTNVYMHDFYIRALLDPEVLVEQHVQNGGEEFRVALGPDGREYSWHGHAVSPMPVDENAPRWWDPRPAVTVTSFHDWAAVAAWARPLYRASARDLEVVRTECGSTLEGQPLDGRALDGQPLDGQPLEGRPLEAPSSEERPLEDRILAAIRFVQDEVRYLGREEGIWSLRPRGPAECLERRYGDCKEKSLLLVSLLGLMDVEAFPLLVSSQHARHLAAEPPTPSAFDHCIVGLIHDGEMLCIDPTSDHQGGGLRQRACHDFGLGLPLTEPCQGLLVLAPPQRPRIEIEHDFHVEAIGSGGMTFEVCTVYQGLLADYQRSYQASTSTEDIGAGNRRYYSKLYPSIEQVAAVECIDPDREGANRITVRESYYVGDAWEVLGDGSEELYLEFYPLELESWVLFAPSPARTAPYDPGMLGDVRVTTNVTLPEPCEVELEPIRISGDGYAFHHEVRSQGQSMRIEYAYELTKPVIEPEATAGFLSAHERMGDQLGIMLPTQLLLATAPPRPGGLAALLFGLSLVGGTLAAFRVGTNYNPPPAADVGAPRRIGGWLLFIAIGVLVAPLTWLVNALASPLMLGLESVDESGLLLYAIDTTGSRLLLYVQLVCQTLLFTFSALVAWAFFSRRTSAPRLYVAVLMAAAAYQTLELAGTAAVMEGFEPGASLLALTAFWLPVLIWGRYFAVSRRVQETFVRRPRDNARVQVNPFPDPPSPPPEPSGGLPPG